MEMQQDSGRGRGKVCILYVGGTIGMQPAQGGYAPADGYFEEQMTRLASRAGRSLPAHEVQSMQPLLDSVDLVPGDWLRMGSWIAREHPRYRGFVIVHGTDTMAYSASALAFLLHGLGKPVVLTGAMAPLGQPASDALPNLVGALHCAAQRTISEVCIYFGGRLLRGCRATKVSAWAREAFDSPNAPHLGSGAPLPRLYRKRLLPPPAAALPPDIPSSPAPVGLITLYPGMDASVLEAALQPAFQGVVLETYGTGSIPASLPGFTSVLRRAVERGCALVNVSQCLEKSPQPGDYQSAAALKEAGVIPGGDMTTEAALTKLFILLSRTLPLETIRQEMLRELCGELTPRPGGAA